MWCADVIGQVARCRSAFQWVSRYKIDCVVNKLNVACSEPYLDCCILF